MPRSQETQKGAAVSGMGRAMLHEILRPYVNSTLAISADSRRAISMTILYCEDRMQVREFVVRSWDLEKAQELTRFSGRVVPAWRRVLVRLGAPIQTEARTVVSRSTNPECASLVDHAGPIFPDWWDSLIRFAEFVTDSSLVEYVGRSAEEPFNCILFSHWALSPDGRCALCGGADGLLRLWSLETGRLLRRFPSLGSPIHCVAFSPSGQVALAASSNLEDGDNVIRLWEVTTGRLLHMLKGHEKLIECATFSPNGQRILSGSDDATVRLWDVGTGKEIRCFGGHKAPVRCVAFSPDGRFALSGAGDDPHQLGGRYDPIRLWRLPK
jgi:WD40 repeat protein